MSILELGALGEFVGSIAVVATLIYLAIQLRQNTAGMRANAYQMWVSSNLDLNSAYAQLGRPWRLGIADATQLDERMGALEESLWKAEISRAAGHLHLNPGVRQWWDAGGRTQLTPEFVELLESMKTDIALWGWDPSKGYHALSRDTAQESHSRPQ